MENVLKKMDWKLNFSPIKTTIPGGMKAFYDFLEKNLNLKSNNVS
jgi:hypothetical protein